MATQEVYALSGLSFTIGWILVVGFCFSLFQWLHIPVGSILDWVIGGASFWWLIVIVTVPWNIHFRAKAVLVDAEISIQTGIEVTNSTRNYVMKIEKISLWVALGLHLVSAIALYSLAILGISKIGYIGSISALLLTALRPVISAYRYLTMRLQNIGQALKYPREDVLELKAVVAELKDKYNQIDWELNSNDFNSLIGRHQFMLKQLQEELAKLSSAHDYLKATNKQDHDRISQEIHTAVAQLSADSLFLDRVREIIRFFKES